MYVPNRVEGQESWPAFNPTQWMPHRDAKMLIFKTKTPADNSQSTETVGTAHHSEILTDAERLSKDRDIELHLRGNEQADQEAKAALIRPLENHFFPALSSQKRKVRTWFRGNGMKNGIAHRRDNTCGKWTPDYHRNTYTNCTMDDPTPSELIGAIASRALLAEELSQEIRQSAGRGLRVRNERDNGIRVQRLPETSSATTAATETHRPPSQQQFVNDIEGYSGGRWTQNWDSLRSQTDSATET